MDKSRSHDILHIYGGNTDAGCKFCQGEMTEAEMKKEATRIAAENYRPQVSKDVPYEKRLMTYEELDADKRNALEDSSFAYIDSKGGRHLPISDSSHVRNALARFSETHFESDEAKQKAKAKIDAAAKKFSVDVSDEDDDDKGEQKNSEPSLVTSVDLFSFAEKNTLPTRIKILPYGTIKSPAYGNVVLNKQVMEEMIKHFEEDLRASSSKIGLPIDVEHGETDLRDAAAGWIKKLFAEKDGGYAEVDWTPLGQKKLTDKEYKLISPSFYLKGFKHPETGKEYQNVLTGAALVNKPGMPASLPPIVNKEQNENTPLTQEKQSSTVFVEIKKLSPNSYMNLKEILQKEKSARTSEEQAFLVEHKEDLSFKEAKAEGFGMDFKEVKIEKKEEVKPGQIVMAEQEVKTMQEELKTFKEKAEKGEQAFKELAEMKKKTDLIEMKEKVRQAAITDKGVKLPADQIDKFAGKLVNMSEEDRKDMLDMITALPTKEIFEEKGSDKAVNMSENTGEQVSALANAKQEEAKKNGTTLSYSQAEQMVYKEKPELRQAVYGR